MENIPKDLLPRPTKSTIICSKHFDSKCYEIGSFFRKKLLKDAVPTIFALNVNKENNDSQLVSWIHLVIFLRFIKNIYCIYIVCKILYYRYKLFFIVDTNR